MNLPTLSSPQHRSSSTIEYLLATMLLCLMLIAVGFKGHDYRPLRWAIQLELAGTSAYGLAMQSRLNSIYPEPFASAGFAYPLPAIWLALPLAALPDGVAGLVWVTLSIASIGLGLRLLRMPATLMLFAPVLLGTSLQQSTVPLVGLLLIGIWALRAERWWILGGVVAFTILAKPQTTLVVSSMLALLALRRGGGLPIFACCLAIAGLTFWLDPYWVPRWLNSLWIYRTHIAPMWLGFFLPAALILLLKKRPYGAVAVVQTFLFPTIVGYALLPLLIGYADQASSERKRFMALVIAASWLGSVLVVVAPIWLAVGGGFVAPLLLDALIAPARSHPGADPAHSLSHGL